MIDIRPGPERPATRLPWLVARGAARLGDTALAAGDAARLTDAGAPQLAASDEGAEVLVWEFA